MNGDSNLQSLKEVDLSDNRLTAFPASLLSLAKLDHINLSRNKISEPLPADMSGLMATELNLNQNQISSLPSSLARCKRLKTLRLEENCLPLEAIPTDLLRDGAVSNLLVAGNLFDEKKLSEVDGYDKYLQRYTAVRRKLD